MQRTSMDSTPLKIEEEWYPSPTVIDGTETELNLEWRELLELHSAGKELERSRLRLALGRGIPHALRPQVWLQFAGCAECMRRQPKVYEQLCARMVSGGPGLASDGVQDQIEKDLRRTESGTSGAKIDALRRVLVAFASFNQEVSYVQGMNFIAAGLLRVLPEPAAFWMLVLIERNWLPSHFSEAMTGNHVDCRVLERLTAEHLPKLSAQLKALDASLQLLAARWFLVFWSSCVTTDATHRLWDLLFVYGPPATMLVALSCLHAVEAHVLAAAELGTAIASAKEALATVPGEQLVQTALYRMGEITTPQLATWRSYCRELVARDAAALQATRGLVRLQRATGYSMDELRRLAHYCSARASESAALMLAIAVDYEKFQLLLCTIVPGWSNDSPLLDRLFQVFAAQPSTVGGESEGGGSGDSVVSGHGRVRGRERAESLIASQASGHVAASPAPSAGGAALTFSQLVCGLAWLLRGDSEKRAALCFACFDADGSGAVQRDVFYVLLQGLYLTYEPPMHRNAPANPAQVARISKEAKQFVDMMYSLWCERPDGLLSAEQFSRAAHQHPLLVQAFQLASLPPPPPDQAGAPDAAPPVTPTRSPLPLPSAPRPSPERHSRGSGDGGAPAVAAPAAADSSPAGSPVPAVPTLLVLTPASASTVCLTIEVPPTVGPPTTPARRAEPVVRGQPEILFDYFASKSSAFRHA